MALPKVSLITVCYNAAPLIEKTLQSALDQTFQDFELVIVDGGSKDETMAKLTPFVSKIGSKVSEKDGGIYDAMNKGVAMAKGEYVYFLNAGDSFYDKHVLQDIFGSSKPTADFLYGRVQTVNEPTGVNYVTGEEVGIKDFYFKYPICHQATFARKKIFDEIGGFNTQFKLISDTDWFIRLFKKPGISKSFMPRVVAFYDVTGATYQKRMLGLREYIKAGFGYFPLWVATANLLSYPLIWLKVKIIRTFSESAWFKMYRRWKFKNEVAS